MIADRWRNSRKVWLVELAGALIGLVLAASFLAPSPALAQVTFSGASSFSPAGNLSRPSPASYDPYNGQWVSGFNTTPSRPVSSTHFDHHNAGLLSVQASDRTWHAQRALDEYGRLAQSESNPVRELAKVNADWVRQWMELNDKQQTLTQRLNDAQWRLRDAEADFQSTREKLDRFGLTRTVGTLLQHKREQLEQWQIAGSESSFGSHELDDAHQKQLLLELRRTDRPV